ncbi:hypothetical protein RN001_015594 [Aquatica leii]|uniref:Uncharacterized protein n=1 Tax=Aquatica leii TaxID=1421715 RepID=A0AAN7SMQ0_9COLE|nr:hypothetical protein RN001_015594 [Aquatica leii]
MVAIQDQVINTRYYKKHIIKNLNTTTDKCRLCKQQIETIDRMITGCTTLANTEYTRTHNNYTPQNILENNEYRLYRNRSVTTNKTTLHNKPDIILTNKKKKLTQLIRISVPNTVNIQNKTEEKIEKYIQLAEEIKDMWHQDKVEIVPIILSATEVILHNLHKYIKTLELHPNIYI